MTLDYEAQIELAQRLIADHAGWSPFQIAKKKSGNPRWNRTSATLEVTGTVLLGLKQRGLIQDSYDPSGVRAGRG